MRTYFKTERDILLDGLQISPRSIFTDFRGSLNIEKIQSLQQMLMIVQQTVWIRI